MDLKRKLIDLLASKLGTKNEDVTKKAGEYLRLLELKTTSSNGHTLKISETCRVVICIDLAASHLGVLLEKEDVVKLSGVKRRSYVNFYHMVEKLLGLHEFRTVKDICIQLGVSETANLAQDLVNRYMSQLTGGCDDSPVVVTGHPMYSAVAIFIACKHLKVKVHRAQLLDLSHIKRLEFDKLARNFEKYVAPLLMKMKPKTQKDNPFHAVLDHHVKESAKASKSTSQLDDELVESYEDWKKRILQQAGK